MFFEGCAVCHAPAAFSKESRPPEVCYACGEGGGGGAFEPQAGGGGGFRKWAGQFCVFVLFADGWEFFFLKKCSPHLCLFKMISASWGSL